MPRTKTENGETLVVKKHATGKVVNEFYTSRDFPTIVDYTGLNGPDNYYSNDDDIIGQTLGSLLGLNVEVTTELTLSQGFVIQTNDMNGRQKKQTVYNEYDDFISGVEYKYKTNITDGTLENKVPTIKENGIISSEEEVGIHYEVINDFQENRAYTKTQGIQGNVAALPFGPFIVVVPMIVPQSSEHTNTFHGVTTTKVIHRTGIMEEKIAYDIGSSVSTKNLAWDAKTGEVLLTETVNEYNDHYFNFNFPAHWYYKGMGMATQNLGIEGKLTKEEDLHEYTLENAGGNTLSDIFHLGDEIIAYHDGEASHPSHGEYERLWVASISTNNDNLVLINRAGELVNDICQQDDLYFKIVRSGFRNQQTATMASVTSMKNPIDIDGDGTLNNITESTYLFFNGQGEDYGIINASSIEYYEAWASQWENGLPHFPSALLDDIEAITYEPNSVDPIPSYAYGFNPYLHNVRGEWRAKKSYAYLTGRNNNEDNASPLRQEGFFNKFKPFYKINNSSWYIDNPTSDDNKWKFASQVSQFSPYGAEVENKDALGRHSSAQYGYNYTLPVAVASNSEYAEMGFDGFEDYEYMEQSRHFGIHNETLTTARPTENTSHTGKYSYKVTDVTTLSLDYAVCNDEVEYIIPDCEDESCINGCTNYPYCDDCLSECTRSPITIDFCGTGSVLMTLSGNISDVDNIVVTSTNDAPSHITWTLEGVNKIRIWHNPGSNHTPGDTFYFVLTVNWVTSCGCAPDCFNLQTNETSC